MHTIHHLCYSLFAFSILVILLSLGSHAVCEIACVIGLEGVGHHGFAPVLSSLFRHALNMEGVKDK